MPPEAGLAIFALLLALYGSVGLLLGRWSITMPMVCVVIGAALGAYGLGALSISPEAEAVKRLTEATLAILLFADASTLNFNVLRHDAALPARLLGIGLPLTIALGALVAFALFPSQGWSFALLVAAILAPTDAALGLPIFTNPKVPVRIRRALNVESGLNDGIATPFVSLFLALAIAEADASQRGWLVNAVEELAIAVGVGIAVGFVGGRFLTFAQGRGWTQGVPLQMAALALAFGAYLGSIAVGGNGFVAAFVGGMAFGVGSRGQLAAATEYSESTGNLLSLLVWSIFGAVFVVPIALQGADPRAILYALLSLTVVRMLPVWVAMAGKRLRPDTRLLMGWFGPRGLASVVFGLLAFDTLGPLRPETQALVSAVTWTILLSVIAHGLSAQPLAAWYARRLAATGGDLPELEDVPEPPTRKRALLGVTPHH